MVWYQMNQQQAKAIDEIANSDSERIIAVVGGALLDQSLAIALESRMRPDADIYKKLFKSSGPLAGANKIDLGYLLYMFEEPAKKAFQAISDIRNQFAHNLDMSFDSQSSVMVQAFASLTLHEGKDKFPSPFWDGDSDHLIETVTDKKSQFLVNLKLALIWIGGDRMRHQHGSNTPTNINNRPQIFAPPGTKTFVTPT